MPKARRPAPTPVRSVEQRLEALRRANEIRVARAQLKRELAGGRVRIEEILATPPKHAETQKVHDLLLAVPKYGPARVARLLAHCRISHSKTVAGLSDRQRAQLLGHFHDQPTWIPSRSGLSAAAFHSEAVENNVENWREAVEPASSV